MEVESKLANPAVSEISKDDSIGWLLYDGNCGVCKNWVPTWEGTFTSLGLEIAPLQTPWVAETLKMSEAELQTDILIFLKDKRIIRGPDVYRFVMKKLWWAKPFYLISILPLFSLIFNWSYRMFARNRFRISRTCGLR